MLTVIALGSFIGNTKAYTKSIIFKFSLSWITLSVIPCTYRLNYLKLHPGKVIFMSIVPLISGIHFSICYLCLSCLDNLELVLDLYLFHYFSYYE